MKLNVKQKKICQFDIDIIDQILNSISEEDWHVDDYRKNAPNMQFTNSIPIFHTPGCVGQDWNDTLKSVKKRPLFNKYYPKIVPILNILKKYYNFNHHASFISKLMPHKLIGIHRDHGKFLLDCHRIHVPIKTNENVIYWIDGDKYFWERGFVYEFDNTLPHGVFNNSAEERIHLVLNLYNLNQEDLEKTNKI